MGFDAYLRYTFGTAGTYYIVVSIATNNNYNVATGNGDTAGGVGAIGDYRLNIQAVDSEPRTPMTHSAKRPALERYPPLPGPSISSLNFASDVNMVSFTVTAGQTVDFDIDTATNGGNGLQSFLRLFDGVVSHWL